MGSQRGRNQPVTVPVTVQASQMLTHSDVVARDKWASLRIQLQRTREGQRGWLLLCWALAQVPVARWAGTCPD